MTVTIVGGGLAGLQAAVACAEAEAEVHLLEARRELGGFARTTAPPYRANHGPHAIYSDGPLWRWLAERDLLPPSPRPGLAPIRFHVDGHSRLVPPAGVVRALLHRGLRAPVERDFRGWATERFGERTAVRLCGAAGVFSFHHDPGALSAAFVWERLLRVSVLPPTARFPQGGWSSLIERLVARARNLGVRIETGARVDSLPPAPVILAAGREGTSRLLGDDDLRWPGARTALLDIGLRRRRGDPYVVSDMDECGWVERFSATDPTLSPDGHELVQAQIGLRPGEPVESGERRIERLLDGAFRDWRARETWRRRMLAESRSGALDPPGASWRDRPAVDRGDGVFVAADMVAAPGLLSEVAHASAIDAAARATRLAHGRGGRAGSRAAA